MEDYDDFEDMEELEEPEDEAAANRRQFIVLVAILGGVLIVAVVAFLFVMLSRNGTKSDIELTNEAVVATNQAIEEAIVATSTAEVVQLTSEAVAMAATQDAQQQAMAETATADALAATATFEALPTATSTATPTPVVPPTTAAEVEENVTPESATQTAEAVAQVTRAATNTPKPSGTTPDTGIGGLGLLLAGAVLVVVLFAARRLRLAS
jgi:hypothetical protein